MFYHRKSSFRNLSLIPLLEAEAHGSRVSPGTLITLLITKIIRSRARALSLKFNNFIYHQVSALARVALCALRREGGNIVKIIFREMEASASAITRKVEAKTGNPARARALGYKAAHETNSKVLGCVRRRKTSLIKEDARNISLYTRIFPSLSLSLSLSLES